MSGFHWSTAHSVCTYAINCRETCSCCGSHSLTIFARYTHAPWLEFMAGSFTEVHMSWFLLYAGRVAMYLHQAYRCGTEYASSTVLYTRMPKCVSRSPASDHLTQYYYSFNSMAKMTDRKGSDMCRTIQNFNVAWVQGQWNIYLFWSLWDTYSSLHDNFWIYKVMRNIGLL